MIGGMNGVKPPVRLEQSEPFHIARLQVAVIMTQPSQLVLISIFARIGILSFGGPAAQIALMHRELVEERSWLNEEQFLSALSFCMLLPGPEAMQLATYAGWRLRGVPGGLIAGLLFVLPGAVVVLALSWAYAFWGTVPLIAAIFLGIKAAVVVIVVEALLRISKRALKRPGHWTIAGLSFAGIFAFDLPFPLLIALAALWGYFKTRETAPPAPAKSTSPLKTVLIWGTIWWAPVAMCWAAGATFLTQIGLFFSKLAVVTFGGAYAVLAYMTQEVVNEKGWLTTAGMVDGLGLAETTPGPLILVTEFVGFQAGMGEAGPELALAAALLTLWVTFVPCFLWIFAGAPYIEQLIHWPRLSGALRAITAAVVGVVLNLSLWFALHVFFGAVDSATIGPVTVPTPTLSSVDPLVVVLATFAAYLLFWRCWSIPAVLTIAGTAAALIAQV